MDLTKPPTGFHQAAQRCLADFVFLYDFLGRHITEAVFKHLATLLMSKMASAFWHKPSLSTVHSPYIVFHLVNQFLAQARHDLSHPLQDDCHDVRFPVIHAGFTHAADQKEKCGLWNLSHLLPSLVTETSSRYRISKSANSLSGIRPSLVFERSTSCCAA